MLFGCRQRLGRNSTPSVLFLCLLGVLSCQEPKPAYTPLRGPLPPRADALSEAGEPQAPPPVKPAQEEADEPPPAPEEPKAPAPLPLLLSALADFDPALGKELGELSLDGTDTCPSEPFRRRLEAHFRRHFDAPLLAKSADPGLRALAKELLNVGPHSEAGHAHHNLALGQAEVTACQPCDYGDPSQCNQEKCDKLREFARPADLSAAGLSEELRFNGHSEATHEGVTTSDDVSLSHYLLAVERAGISHPVIVKECRAITEQLLRRCRYLEEPLRSKPLDLPPLSPFSQALVSALSALKAVYQPQKPALSNPARYLIAADENGRLYRSEGYIALEQRLTARFTGPSASKWRRGMLDLRRENLALDRGEPSPGGLEMVPADLDPEEYPSPCLRGTSKDGEPLFELTCLETREGLSLLEWGLLTEEPKTEEEIELVALKLAAGLERLFDAGVPVATLEREMQAFVSDANRAAKRPPKEAPQTEASAQGSSAN